jgi:hypothetical protein
MNLDISFRSNTKGPLRRESMWSHRTGNWTKLLAIQVKAGSGEIWTQDLMTQKYLAPAQLLRSPRSPAQALLS